MLNRREAVRRLLEDRGDMLVVAGLGQPCYDCFAAGDDPRNFYLWGAMGGAVPAGLGLALARPERRVVVVTGDGDALMSTGAFATVGAEAPENLAICILDNERYGETGGQVTHTARGADLAAMAAAGGVRQTRTVRTEEELEAAIGALRRGAGPLVAVVKVAPESEPGALPPQDGTHLKRRFRGAALGIEDK